MLATLLSAALTCAAALVLGQVTLAVCGLRQWSWFAAPVGISVTMLIAVVSLHTPGRATTVGVVLGLAVIGGIGWMVRHPAHRPPLSGLSAGLPVMALALIPFAVAGRAGTLGVSVNNDMASHLLMAEAHISESVMQVHPLSPSYPVGPHAVVAAIAAPLGMPVDLAFAGFLIACPVLLGWTALAALRHVSVLGQWFVAVLTGMAYLVAAYYGQGSFKEVQMATLTMGTALLLGAHPVMPGRGRWVPLGLVVAGMIAVYSYSALAWPAVFFGVWCAAVALRTIWRHRDAGTEILRIAFRKTATEAVPFALASIVAALALASQAPRIRAYLADTGGGTGIDKSSLGNLVGRLPFWEGLGVWDANDYRTVPVNQLAAGASAGVVLALAIVAGVWWIRRGDWMLPFAALSVGVMWAVIDESQAPYVAGKALVIFAPYVMLLISRPLVEADGWRSTLAWGRLAVPVGAVILLYAATGSSWKALRHSAVGPRDHALELREFRPLVREKPTLFLGNDDFLKAILPDVPVQAPLIATPDLPIPPEKAWQYGEAHDIDSVTAADINAMDYVITPRDAAGSALPPQLHLVRQTQDFALYRREGRVAERSLLPEGQNAFAQLDCRNNAEARRLSHRSGIAAVRRGQVALGALQLAAGGDRVMQLALPRGTWDIVMQYVGGLGFRVSAPGLRTVRMAPNLDRPGPRYPVGRISLKRKTIVPLRIRVDAHPLASTALPVWITTTIAVPVGTERVVPLRKACGRLVDYYRLARR